VATVSIPGGGSYDPTVYGPATVIAGSGNDAITIIGSGEVSVGNGNDTITIGSPSSTANWQIRGGSAGRAIRGEGTRGDTESAGRALRGAGLQTATSVQSSGTVIAGYGNDSITLYSGGQVAQNGLQGHDTINLGTGNDTIYEQGHATVYGTFSNGAFGSASIAGGELKVIQSGGVTQDIAVSGRMTLVGSSAHTEFVGGTGSTLMTGASGYDTFVGGSGSDTMVGAGSQNVFQFLSSEQGGQHVISNFTSGDKLYIEGQGLSYLQSQHDITTSGGNTYISIDGGHTTIELKGFTGLSNSDITSHK
jgi:Ca2+-binding RTX toxin-like protein